MGLLKSQFFRCRFKKLRPDRGRGPLAAGMRIVPALSPEAGFGPQKCLESVRRLYKMLPSLAAMIRELAEFERELDAVTIRAEDLAQDGFGENPRFRALIADWGTEHAGYA